MSKTHPRPEVIKQFLWRVTLKSLLPPGAANITMYFTGCSIYNTLLPGAA